MQLASDQFNLCYLHMKIIAGAKREEPFKQLAVGLLG